MQILLICQRNLRAQKFKKPCFFGLFLAQQSVFYDFTQGHSDLSLQKLLLIDFTAKNTLRKVYRTENTREIFYYQYLVLVLGSQWLDRVIEYYKE